jgi:hypothetical protein
MAGDTSARWTLGERAPLGTLGPRLEYFYQAAQRLRGPEGENSDMSSP